jgi:uncharacterized hydantoinase/oxoprolinase family protein
MGSLLGLDLGGKNVKFALAELLDSRASASLVTSGQVRAPTLHEGFYDVNSFLQNNMDKSELKQIVTVLVASSATAAYSSLLEGVHEIYSMTKSFIKDFNENALVFFISRDGSFSELKTIDQEANLSPRNIYKYIDAYWYPSSMMASEEAGFEDFVYVDMGSSSTSIIPFKKGRPVVDLLENRLVSGKLIPIGILHTPVIYILNELELFGRRFRVFPYVPTYTSDLMNVIGNVSDERLRLEAEWKMARYVAEDPLFVNKETVREVASQLYETMRSIIKSGVTNILRSYYSQKVPLVLAGSGKVFLSKTLRSFETHILGFGNAHVAVGLLCCYLKSKLGCKLEIAEKILE